MSLEKFSLGLIYNLNILRNIWVNLLCVEIVENLYDDYFDFIFKQKFIFSGKKINNI